MKMKQEKLVCAMAVVWIVAIWCAEGGEAMRMMSNSWSNTNVNVRAHGHSDSWSHNANVNVRAHGHSSSWSHNANVNVRTHGHSNSWNHNANVNVRAQYGHSNSNSDWRGRFGSVKRRVPTGSNPLHNRSYMDRVHFDSERH